MDRQDLREPGIALPDLSPGPVEICIPVSRVIFIRSDYPENPGRTLIPQFSGIIPFHDHYRFQWQVLGLDQDLLLFPHPDFLKARGRPRQR
jgi:hypothetical protein